MPVTTLGKAVTAMSQIQRKKFPKWQVPAKLAKVTSLRTKPKSDTVHRQKV